MDNDSILAKVLECEGNTDIKTKLDGMLTLYEITTLMFADNKELVARLMTCDFIDGRCWKANLERFLKRRGWEKHKWPEDKPILTYWKIPPDKKVK